MHPARTRTSDAFERAAFGLLCALVVWAPIPLGSHRPWAWSILEAGLFAAGLCWLVGWSRRDAPAQPALRAARPALILFAAWLAWLLLQWLPMPAAAVRALSPASAALHAGADYLGAPGRWITLSVDPHASFVFWLKSCAYGVAFFLVLALLGSHRRVAIFCGAIVASGLLQAFAGGLLHLSHAEVEILGMGMAYEYWATGTFVNRNHFAGLLEMSLATGIGLMIGQLADAPPRPWRRAIADTAALLLSGRAMLRLILVIMVIALVMSRSRMGNIAFFTSLLATGALALAFSRGAPRSTSIFIASLVAIDLLLVGAWFGAEHTVRRIAETTQADVGARAEPGALALHILREYPVFGSGAGTFYVAFPKHRTGEVRDFYDYAHDDYVQFLVETGVVGFGLAGAFAAAGLACAVLALVRRRDALLRGVAFGATMGLLSIAIHSAVDFNLQIPANAFLFVCLLGLGWVALHLDRPVPAGRA